VRHKVSEVHRESGIFIRDSEMEEELVLVEVTVDSSAEVRTIKADYEYVREQILQEMKI
jgi:hypothetical protein